MIWNSLVLSYMSMYHITMRDYRVACYYPCPFTGLHHYYRHYYCSPSNTLQDARGTRYTINVS